MEQQPSIPKSKPIFYRLEKSAQRQRVHRMQVIRFDKFETEGFLSARRKKRTESLKPNIWKRITNLNEQLSNTQVLVEKFSHSLKSLNIRENNFFGFGRGNSNKEKDKKLRLPVAKQLQYLRINLEKPSKSIFKEIKALKNLHTLKTLLTWSIFIQVPSFLRGLTALRHLRLTFEADYAFAINPQMKTFHLDQFKKALLQLPNLRSFDLNMLHFPLSENQAAANYIFSFLGDLSAPRITWGLQFDKGLKFDLEYGSRFLSKLEGLVLMEGYLSQIKEKAGFFRKENGNYLYGSSANRADLGVLLQTNSLKTIYVSGGAYFHNADVGIRCPKELKRFYYHKNRESANNEVGRVCNFLSEVQNLENFGFTSFITRDNISDFLELLSLEGLKSVKSLRIELALKSEESEELFKEVCEGLSQFGEVVNLHLVLSPKKFFSLEPLMRVLGKFSKLEYLFISTDSIYFGSHSGKERDLEIPFDKFPDLKIFGISMTDSFTPTAATTLFDNILRLKKIEKVQVSSGCLKSWENNEKLLEKKMDEIFEMESMKYISCSLRSKEKGFCGGIDEWRYFYS